MMRVRDYVKWTISHLEISKRNRLCRVVPPDDEDARNLCPRQKIVGNRLANCFGDGAQVFRCLFRVIASQAFHSTSRDGCAERIGHKRLFDLDLRAVSGGYRLVDADALSAGPVFHFQAIGIRVEKPFHVSIH